MEDGFAGGLVHASMDLDNLPPDPEVVVGRVRSGANDLGHLEGVRRGRYRERRAREMGGRRVLGAGTISTNGCNGSRWVLRRAVCPTSVTRDKEEAEIGRERGMNGQDEAMEVALLPVQEHGGEILSVVVWRTRDIRSPEAQCVADDCYEGVMEDEINYLFSGWNSIKPWMMRGMDDQVE